MGALERTELVLKVLDSQLGLARLTARTASRIRAR